MYQRRSMRRHEVAELNITAFMNLMVILVPFLLITAVFSRVAVLELNVPDAAPGTQAAEKAFALEVIVRDDGVLVSDRNSGPLKLIPVADSGHDLEALSSFLQAVKTQYPDKQSAAILLEPDTSYDTLVQVMDAVRNARVEQGGEFTWAELFPDISIGDAPRRQKVAGTQ